MAGETDTLELQGIIALELRRNLLIRSNLFAKRLIDLTLGFFSSIVVLPLLGMIALAVCVDSGFPAFFGQKRIGRGGRPFTAWKFRTMTTLAGESLTTILDQTQDLKSEWESSRKLKHDPRITKVGKVLRRLSLDELPQFLNVIKGEMSLVGPRPIIEEEIPKYGDSYDLYTQVSPGLTGLWQVSGRSNLPYRDRVWLDSHYVRNWSVWLDLVILVRTVWVVIAGIGAY